MDLQIGKKYIVTETLPNGRENRRSNLGFTGVLIEEYERFYLFQCKNYKATLLKAMLMCGRYSVEAV